MRSPKEEKYANETQLKRALIGHLKTVPGLYFFSNPAGPYRKAGIEDITVIWGGLYIGIEAKTPEAYNKPNHNCSPAQRLHGKKLKQAGAEYWVISTVEQLKECFDGLGKSLRIRGLSDLSEVGAGEGA